MTDSTNVYIDGEHAATITELKHDLPWHYGVLVPAKVFQELLDSLDKAPYSTNKEGAVELVAGQDTVDRVSWGSDVDASEMITQLTLARFEEDGPWELEFTCEEETAPVENGAGTAEA